MVYCDEDVIPKKRYCGTIREGVINQLTHKYNNLPVEITEENAMLMWENGVAEVHLTQHELLSMDLERFWYKDKRVTNTFRWTGKLIKKEINGKLHSLVCFQELDRDQISLTIVGEPDVIQYINENKRYMAEKPEAIQAKEDNMDNYKNPCWWTQFDYEYRVERFDKNNNRLTTIDDYDFKDFMIWDTWNNVKRNRRRPVLEKIIQDKEAQLEKYREKFSQTDLLLIDAIGNTEYVQEIRKCDGKEFWEIMNESSEFKVIFAGTEVGKDLAWSIWQRYRMPELEHEINKIKEELESY